MSYVNELFPPMQYQPGWGWLLLALFVVLFLVWVTIFVMTKATKIDVKVVPLPVMVGDAERFSLIKNKYAEDIQLVGLLHADKKISTRKAFQSLSSHLRNFSHEYSMTGAYSMTLADLKNKNVPLVKDKIENFYPFAFQEAERDGNVQLAVEDALKVIQLWR